MRKSPFKFLDSYSKEDQDLFFGRNKEIEELHSRVFESKILVVYGISGTGKSSLINCGLANKFNDSDWLPIAIRRGLDINLSLQNSLAESSIAQPKSDKSQDKGGKSFDIIKVIRSIYLDHFKPIYLIFDQFEELFIFGHKEEKNDLVNNIKKLIDSDLQCRFIFSIREEYLAGMTEFEKVIPSFLANRIRIEKMTRQNAIQVIEGPCKVADIALEPGFSEALLEKLSPGSLDVELTYLQVFLDRILRLASGDTYDRSTTGWETSARGTDRQKNVAFSISLLTEAGNVSDLLGRFLEEQISQLEDPDLGLVILKSFVSVRGTKQQITEEEVLEYSKTLGKDIENEAVRNLIQKFIGLRILRDKDQNGRYELRHDSLATKIYEKITLVEKELLEIRQFTENAFNNFEKRHLYLTSEDLAYIAPYEDKLFLNEKLIKFIAQSKWVIHRARRRRQNIFIGVTVLIISVLSFFTIWAFRERGNALQQKQFADEQTNSALKAKEVADSARLQALQSRNMAVEKEAQALLAQKQSDLARKEALAEREYALEQKNRAEKLSITANEQAKIANEERLKAEQERVKAVAAEINAKRLTFLSTAQNLALKSSAYKRSDPMLMGRLAQLAYTFNKDKGGNLHDPIIWEALYNSWSNFENSRHSRFSGSPNEIRTMAWQENNLITADLDGKIRSWTEDGANKETGVLILRSPLAFIRFILNGKKVLTQSDDLNVLLWDTRSLEAGNQVYQDLTGHTGIINLVASSQDNRIMATSGSDSLTIIWNIADPEVSKIRTFKSHFPVKAMIFCNSDSIIYSTENGSIMLFKISLNENIELYRNLSDKPLSLAWNSNKNILFAGCVNGTLLSMDIAKYISDKPKQVIVHAAGIDMLVFNSDFSLLASSSWDKTIKIYNYNDFFELENNVTGVVHLNNLNYRVRSLIFTGDNKLIAGLSDKTICLWETSPEILSNKLKDLGMGTTGGFTENEWIKIIGPEIPFEKTKPFIPDSIK